MAVDALKIRTIGAEDTRALRWQVLRPGRPFEETIFAADSLPSTLHLGAWLDGAIVGVASVTPEACRFDPKDGDWQLRGMATTDALQGHGIGSVLLTACFERVVERGGRRLWCNGRTSALRFYERLGFRRVGEEFNHPVSGPHFLLIRIL